MSSNIGNPISSIQTRLQTLRSERELVDAEITLYEQEKEAIKQILPRMLAELNSLRSSGDAKQSEVNIYDKAIEEIESTYGHILFTPEFYNS